MAKDTDFNRVSLQSLDKPEKLSSVLQKDYVDCMSCRLMGTSLDEDIYVIFSIDGVCFPPRLIL